MRKTLLLFFSLLFYSTFATGEAITVELNNGTEIPVSRYPADGHNLLIWLPSEAGLPSSLDAMASTLSKQGTEIWLTDMLEAYFLPVANSSMAKIPAEDISALISKAHQQTGKTVYLAGSGRATIPILNGTRLWQLDHTDQQGFGGIIFISPKFYLETPAPGKPPSLLTIVENSNVAAHIIQASDSPWRWKLEQTIPALEKNGSDISLKLVRNVRDRFYYRPDATTVEQQLSGQLPRFIKQGIRLLHLSNMKNRVAVRDVETSVKLASSKKERELKPYPGQPAAYELSLRNLRDENINLVDYRGKVVLVNFWASWCPPCVHEMPSMQRLQDQLKKSGFEILAVNMAEEKQTIEHFLATKVKVDFTIVQDSNGEALKRWGVFAFPTSYIIGKQGKIRYALFGAVDWRDPAIVSKIEALLAE